MPHSAGISFTIIFRQGQSWFLRQLRAYGGIFSTWDRAVKYRMNRICRAVKCRMNRICRAVKYRMNRICRAVERRMNRIWKDSHAGRPCHSRKLWNGFLRVYAEARRSIRISSRHSLSFADSGKSQAKNTMDAYLGHMKSGMAEALKSDKAVRKDVSQAFPEKMSFWFRPGIIVLLLQRKKDCRVLLQMVLKTIYWGRVNTGFQKKWQQNAGAKSAGKYYRASGTWYLSPLLRAGSYIGKSDNVQGGNKMQAIFETVFDILYLTTVVTLGIRMIRGCGGRR